MLLVKSRESKSLNSYKTIKSIKTGCYALFLSSLCTPAFAQEGSSALGGTSSFISIFLALLLVIAIIFALAFIMRRFNVTQSGNGQMKVLASMMAGAKEKVMVIEVGGEQHLLGITAHNINHLATLATPIESNNKSMPVEGKAGFQQKLVQAMAHSISGKKFSSASNSSASAKGRES